MRYVLILAGWYPSRVDPLTGDFVQRHAESVSLYEKVIVLFLVKDPVLDSALKVEKKVSGDGNYIEYIVYYRVRGPFQGVRSLLRYLFLGAGMIRRIKKEQGIPALVHLNGIGKAGWLALYLKRRYGWEFIVTEHWAGYTMDNPVGLHTQSWLTKKNFKAVYRQTKLLLPVSRDLGLQVNQWFPGTRFEVVYNVVDTRHFYYQPERQNQTAIKKCVHVSSMSYQKNIEGILHVIEQLVVAREDVEFTLVGPYTPQLQNRLAEKGLLDKKVFLTGVLSYPEVAEVMRGSNLLVLFSRYENQPCVILEALCCGLPVIATRVGGIPEIVDQSNGILVESEREDQLLQAFNDALDHYSRYDRAAIAAASMQKFSYAVIGEQFARIYRRHLSLL